MRPLSASLLATVSFALTLHAQTACTAKGKDRWSVKTSAPLTSVKAHAIAPAAFVQLAVPATVSSKTKGAKTLEDRYPDAVNGLHEGELVSVTGWVRFIKTASDDCDYHIQVTPAENSDAGMIVAEVPEPDAIHVSDPSLRQQLATVRNAIMADLHLAKGPSKSGNVIGKAYMTFEGALFFDAWHYPDCGSRGVGMQAMTCWEIHPVTAARFAPRP